MMIALYWSRSGSLRLSRRRIPSVMYLMKVDWRERREGEGREREREGGRGERGGRGRGERERSTL